LGGMPAKLLTKCLEIKGPILVLLVMLHAGVPILTSNGKSRSKEVFAGMLQFQSS